MHTTPVSLLERLRHGAEDVAWSRLVRLYTPLVYHWARRFGLREQDAADLVQDVFALLLEKLPEFDYDPRRSFRSWLRTVTLSAWGRLRQSSTADTTTGLNTSGSGIFAREAPEALDFLARPERPDELGRLGGYRVLRRLGAGGMDFLGDGRTLVVAGADGTIQWREAPTGRVQGTLASEAGFGALTAMAVAPGGDMLAAAYADGNVRLWSTKKRELERSYPLVPGGNHIKHLAFSPEGRHLAVALSNGSIYLLRVDEASQANGGR